MSALFFLGAVCRGTLEEQRVVVKTCETEDDRSDDVTDPDTLKVGPACSHGQAKPRRGSTAQFESRWRTRLRSLAASSGRIPGSFCATSLSCLASVSLPIRI